MTDIKIAVVGSGVVGVTTGIELLKTFRNAEVSIIAENFNEDTTSYVAAGIFRPGGTFRGESAELTQKWIDDSYYYWNDIQNSSYGGEAGVAEISGYMFSNRNEKTVRNPYIEKLLPIYRRATEEELTSLCPQKWKYGSFYTTLVTDNSIHLPWAMKKFKLGGGQVLRQHVKSLPELGQKYDMIVNCTGLGAQTLCNDHHLVPIRGQVIKVEAPWMKMFFYGEMETYIIPGIRYVTLGGCNEFGSYNLEQDEHVAQGIRDRCYKLVPSIKPGIEIKQLVGLRPYRPSVRIEKEVLQNSTGKKVKVVHNYGHGAYGVTTAPGTSLYAVELVKQSWLGNSKL